jgi:hypothetical protein
MNATETLRASQGIDPKILLFIEKIKNKKEAQTPITMGDTMKLLKKMNNTPNKKQQFDNTQITNRDHEQNVRTLYVTYVQKILNTPEILINNGIEFTKKTLTCLRSKQELYGELNNREFILLQVAEFASQKIPRETIRLGVTKILKTKT